MSDWPFRPSMLLQARLTAGFSTWISFTKSWFCCSDDTWLDVHQIDSTAPADDVEGYCSGDWTGGQIVDEVIIPKDLEPGNYVVGWRWSA
jgi:hypothetical protein